MKLICFVSSYLQIKAVLAMLVCLAALFGLLWGACGGQSGANPASADQLTEVSPSATWQTPMTTSSGTPPVVGGPVHVGGPGRGQSTADPASADQLTEVSPPATWQTPRTTSSSGIPPAVGEPPYVGDPTRGGIAIQEVIDETVAAGGGPIHIAAGDWYLSSPLRIFNARNIILKGEGSATRLIVQGNVDPLVLIHSSQNIQVLDLSFVGDMQFLGMKGIKAENSSNLTFCGNDLQQLSSVGIYIKVDEVDDPFDPVLRPRNNIICNNRITNGGDFGISLHHADNTVVYGNFVEGLSGPSPYPSHCYYVSDGNENRIVQNYCGRSATGAGIEIVGSRRVITDNIVAHNTLVDNHSGIHSVDSQGTLIIGNTIRRTTKGEGIQVWRNSTENIIQGNSVFKTAGIGILVGSGEPKLQNGQHSIHGNVVMESRNEALAINNVQDASVTGNVLGSPPNPGTQVILVKNSERVTMTGNTVVPRSGSAP